MQSDFQIQKNVMDELRWEPILTATEIGVSVSKGVVTLSGTVNSFFKKYAAEKVARRVKDVKGVVMNLEVTPLDGDRRTDSQIAEAAMAALAWHTAIPADAVKVEIEKGKVTLYGMVPWHYQKEAAEKAVRNLKGVVQVVNQIAIEPTVQPEAVKSSIRRALERNADVEAAGINIDAAGSRVVLRGHVHSMQERRIVENAAWSSPGVVAVEDCLLVEA